MVVMVAVSMWMPVMRGSTEEVLVLWQLGDSGPCVLCWGSHVLKKRKLIRCRLIAFMSRKKVICIVPWGRQGGDSNFFKQLTEHERQLIALLFYYFGMNFILIMAGLCNRPLIPLTQPPNALSSKITFFCLENRIASAKNIR